MFITAEIDMYDMKRVLIDSEISIDIFFLDAMKNMGNSDRNLHKVNLTLMGFASITTYPMGSLPFQYFWVRGGSD